MLISEYLKKGAAGAQTNKELCFVLGVSSDDVRRMIRTERLAGVPICSRCGADRAGGAGYYLPETAEELQAMLAQLKSREKEIRRTRRALEKAFEAMAAD